MASIYVHGLLCINDLPMPSQRFQALAMAMAHASRSTAPIETFRSGAIGGRRMIPVKGNTNGAPVIIGGVDLRSIVVNAVHIARFRTPSGTDLITIPER